MGNKSKRAPRKPKTKVALGYCHPEKVSAIFHISVLGMMRAYPIDSVLSVWSGPKVDQARNSIFRRWLEETDCTHLQMVDTDMGFPPDTIPRLLEHDKDIVGGLYFAGRDRDSVTPNVRVISRREDGTGTLEPLWDYPLNSLVRVDGVGTGCMLIKREVAEEVWKARGKDHPLPWFAHGVHNGVEIGEDIAFCLTAGKVGFEVWLDTSITYPHEKPSFVTEREYVLSLSRDNHPYYDYREKVPIYQELLNDEPS
jgi:hypothetical protein